MATAATVARARGTVQGLSEAEVRRALRRWRYALREGLARLTTLERVSRCGRTPYAPKGGKVTGPTIRRDPETGQCGYGGLETCGSIWACPVCSAAIRQGRAVEIGEAATRWMHDGHGLAFMTLTLSHKRSDRLASTLDVVAKGFRNLLTGRQWQRLREQYGIVGPVRAVEITYGGNGWHPHLHVMWFTETPLDDEALTGLGDALFGRWEKWLAGHGYSADRHHGLDMRPVVRNGDALGWYLAKVQDAEGYERSLGLEVARGDVKRGRKGSRTPFEVLEDAIADPAGPDAKLYREYEQATRGRRAITWGHEVRRRLALADEDTDEALAAVEPPEIVFRLDPYAWKLLVTTPGARGAALDVAEREGAAGVERYLRRLVDRRTGRWRRELRKQAAIRRGVDPATGEFVGT